MPSTVGEHLLRKRQADGLIRRELAARLEIREETLLNWELGHTKTVPAAAMPVILAYLGYNPEPKPEAFGAQLRWKRRALGWCIQEAARRNSVDPSTWEQWEKAAGPPKYRRYREFLGEFIDGSTDQLADSVRRVVPTAP